MFVIVQVVTFQGPKYFEYQWKKANQKNINTTMQVETLCIMFPADISKTSDHNIVLSTTLSHYQGHALIFSPP